jgi:hypothetical protein
MSMHPSVPEDPHDSALAPGAMTIDRNLLELRDLKLRENLGYLELILDRPTSSDSSMTM